MMTTNRKLTIGIITLLIVNLIVLGFLFISHKKNSKRKDMQQRPGHILVKKLDFNKEQAASFYAIKKAHRENIRTQDEKIRVIKTTIFNSLGDTKEVNIDSLSTLIGDLQKDIEVAHYNHFIEIKNLCKGGQIEKFNALSKEFSKIFKPRGRHPKKLNKN